MKVRDAAAHGIRKPRLASIAHARQVARIDREFNHQSVCKSLLPEGLLWIPVGNLVQDCGARPTGHIFVASKAPWYVITDDLPRADAYPPGIDAPVVTSPTPPAAHDDSIAGSCLCGAIRFELAKTPRRPFMRNCHCSRCRFARSAAHASNLYADPAQFHWAAGEDAVRVFDLPGALRFGNNFCGTCGSKLPRMGRMGRVVIPGGALDGDPGLRPDYHIFTAYKAPWFEITDSLRRYPEAAD